MSMGRFVLALVMPRTLIHGGTAFYSASVRTTLPAMEPQQLSLEPGATGLDGAGARTLAQTQVVVAEVCLILRALRLEAVLFGEKGVPSL
jgi:hypothetical protein